jgi:hypothetical protein
VVVELASEHADREREMTAELVDLRDRWIRSVNISPADEPDEQRRSLLRRQGLEADRGRVVECAEVATAGDKDQTAGSSRQERLHLVMAGRIV